MQDQESTTANFFLLSFPRWARCEYNTGTKVLLNFQGAGEVLFWGWLLQGGRCRSARTLTSQAPVCKGRCGELRGCCGGGARGRRLSLGRLISSSLGKPTCPGLWGGGCRRQGGGGCARRPRKNAQKCVKKCGKCAEKCAKMRSLL